MGAFQGNAAGAAAISFAHPLGGEPLRFMIDLADARMLVATGEAEKDDFLLLVGYCGRLGSVDKKSA